MEMLDQSVPSATELGKKIREGDICPVQLAHYTLRQVAEYSDQNIFITVTAERAMWEARAAKSRIEAGQPASLLDGVPIAWKDNIDVAGAPTTVGSLLFKKNNIAATDQVAVRNVAAGGMVCIGKLNMTEFAYSGLGLNPHFGTPRNPNDQLQHRSPGGSSSGSGVAVSAGLVPCAIGTDTGGSVRVPAAFNGVFGYKTSEAVVDTTGVFPLSKTLDTLGPIARSISDCIYLTQLMQGLPTVPLTPVGVEELRIIVPDTFALEGAEPAVVKNFEQTLGCLEAAGVEVQRVSMPMLMAVAKLCEVHGTLTAAEAYYTHQTLVDGPSSKVMDQRVVRRILNGKKMSAFDILEIQNKRQSYRQRISDFLDGALLAMPTVPIVAPVIGNLEQDDKTFMRVNALTLRNAVLCNVLNFCALAMPNGNDQEGMPTSFMVCAPDGADSRLLASGLTLEKLVSQNLAKV
jgi:aspartyl-tRNA(Asn)/glutamyl-tRNA(Gln) amidotransferase subunit A